MVSDSFTNTFAKELEALATDEDLKNFCSAAALFYWDDNHNLGTRIEATQIMAEFVDNVEFGRDPEGLLFYSDAKDLTENSSEDSDPYYRIHLNTENTKAIRIDFFWKDPRVEDNKNYPPFAKFITRDTASIPEDTMKSLDKHTNQGKWQKIQLGVCSATLSKNHNGVAVKLTVASIKKSVKFDVHEPGENATEEEKKKAYVRISNAHGVLHFTRIDDLGKGKEYSASYDSDRVIYYDKDNRKKLIGVFLPTSEPLPSEFNNHGDQKPPTATWSDI